VKHQSLKLDAYLFAGSHPILPENPSQGDQTLKLALEALDASDYPHALTFINESLEQGISWAAGKAEALNLRGTFKYVVASHFYEP
jgi:mitochondrial import receptor subunit TOM70